MKTVIRVDASLILGSGHVMRCLALATALRDAGVDVIFVCREFRGHLCDHISAQGFTVLRLPLVEPQAHIAAERAPPGREFSEEYWRTDVAETANALKSHGRIDWLVVDHYALDHRWEKEMRKAAAHLMVIDDLADRLHDCDLLLDQNFVDEMQTRYRKLTPLHCEALIGPRFALLRPEFADVRQNMRHRKETIHRVLVFFGGVDLGNETAKAILALKMTRSSGFEVDVVVGAQNPHREEISSLCSTAPIMRYHCQVDNMPELMAAADLSIGAGGGAMWERCSLGLPSIVMSTADNQRDGCEALGRAGGILYLGSSEGVDVETLASALQVAFSSPYLLASLSATALSLVDGRGIDRVVRQIVKKAIDLRLATAEDSERIYRWRNSEEVRRYSGNSQRIPHEEHVRWFDRSLVDPNRVILIGEIAGEPIGVLRYDRERQRSRISVYLVPGKQERGIGTQLIQRGTSWIVENWPDIAVIDAEIDVENAVSAGAFENAGFRRRCLRYSRIIESEYEDRQ